MIQEGTSGDVRVKWCSKMSGGESDSWLEGISEINERVHLANTADVCSEWWSGMLTLLLGETMPIPKLLSSWRSHKELIRSSRATRAGVF